MITCSVPWVRLRREEERQAGDLSTGLHSKTHCRLLLGKRSEQAQNLFVIGKTLLVQLRKRQFTVDADFKAPAVGWHDGEAIEVHLFFVEDFFRQTDGSGKVSSPRAILNFNFLGHDILLDAASIPGAGNL